MQCSKCNGSDIKKKLIADGALINSSSFAEVKTEFIYSIEYEYYYKLKAKKEHMLNSCACGNTWREDVPNV